MNLIVEITLYLSLFMGGLLLIVAAGNQVFRKESPISFLFVGLALMALPLATKIKVGPEGAELEIRQELAAVEAKIQAVAETRGESFENPLASKLLALVMYNNASSADQNEVLGVLKKLGYLASSVATDYSELGSERNKYKTGQAYIKYRKGLESEAVKIKESLEKVNGINTITTKEVSGFRTGDIQVALF
jgi:hypothetical protein